MHRIIRARTVAIVTALALFIGGLVAAPALALPAIQTPPQPVQSDDGGVSFIPGLVVIVLGNQSVLVCPIQPQPSAPPSPCIRTVGMDATGAERIFMS